MRTSSPCPAGKSPSRVKRLTTGTTLTSKVVTQLYEPSNDRYTHAGFLSFDRVSTLHELVWPAAGDPVFRSLCDFEGYRLPPGSRFPLKSSGFCPAFTSTTGRAKWRNATDRSLQTSFPPAGSAGHGSIPSMSSLTKKSRCATRKQSANAFPVSRSIIFGSASATSPTGVPAHG